MVVFQALVMLGGPAGGVPAVRAYALRSLRTCVPEQVLVPPSVKLRLTLGNTVAVMPLVFRSPTAHAEEEALHPSWAAVSPDLLHQPETFSQLQCAILQDMFLQ